QERRDDHERRERQGTDECGLHGPDRSLARRAALDSAPLDCAATMLRARTPLVSIAGMATTRTAGVGIIGGGVTGASPAVHLTQRGVRDVVVVDKGSLASGGTGKSSACVRQHYSTAETCRMILYSLNFFQHFAERVGGESCGFRHTGYLLGVDDKMRAPMEA